jgi:tetratricopeptide (TPR) repeat protein
MSSRARRTIFVCGMLAAATLAVYGQVVRFDYVGYDDRLYVTDNVQVRKGITGESVLWALTSGFESNWFPLTRLSHMLDVEIFGLEPGGHHVTNALLHLLNALLLYAVLEALTGAPWRSAFVAALFALHPLQVESVAWVSERKSVLSTSFGLLSIGAYGAYARRGGLGRYLAAAGLLALGLMAKPMLVTLPCVFLLLDYWPLGRSDRSVRDLVLEKLPFFALSAVSSAITAAIQSGGRALVGLDLLSVPQRLTNAAYSYASYLGKTFWPNDLVLFPPHPFLASLGGTPLTVLQVTGAVLLLLAISAAVVVSKRRYALVGWLWFLGMLVPVIGLVQVGGQGMADRYAYLPGVGIFIAVTWAGADLYAAVRSRRPRLAALLGIVPILVLVLCVGVARNQTKYWRDSFALFEHVLEVTPRNPTIRYNLANAYRKRGELDESIAHYRRALQVSPEDADIHNNLANSLRDLGRGDEALAHYREALRLRPTHYRAHNNLGSLLRKRGADEAAIRHLRESLRIAPDFGRAHYNLGNALAAQGEVEGAIEHFRTAIRIDPGDWRAHNNLGVELQGREQLDEALAHFRIACQLNPEYATAHRNRGVVLQLRGDFEAAIAAYREALRIEPGYVSARADLGTALHNLGSLDEAIDEYRRALEIDPSRTPVRRNLSDALAERGEMESQ